MTELLARIRSTLVTLKNWWESLPLGHKLLYLVRAACRAAELFFEHQDFIQTMFDCLGKLI